MPSLGDEFRIGREARGLSLSDVAEQLHIRSTYLQAIEEEDWATIGAPVYVRGFLRTYARFLGIDPEHAVEAFGRSQPAAPAGKQRPAAPIGVPRSSGGLSVWAQLATLVAVALLAYVGYSYYQLKMTAPPVTPTPFAVPTSAGAAVIVTPAPKPTTPAPRWTGKGLVVEVSQLTWLRVNVDGKTVLEGEFPPGTRREFVGKHVRVVAGNAGGVQVSAPGEPTRILGSAGQVVERDYYLQSKKVQ